MNHSCDANAYCPLVHRRNGEMIALRDIHPGDEFLAITRASTMSATAMK
jgi:hypothetical protein